MDHEYAATVDGVFRGAADYRCWRDTHFGVVHEPHEPYPFAFSERHLQCVWYDPALRPAQLTTSEGEAVTVEDPGIWNLEAGPDFLGAALLVNGQRRIAGDVEIHLRSGDWKQHGHHTDPRYNQVRVHVTYRAGSISEALFPKGTIHIALQPVLHQMPGFSFEAIDTTAYPYCSPGNPPPCRQHFKKLMPQQVTSFLESAGEERLRRKALRLRQELAVAAPDQVLYEELFTALGYKNNKIPFRRLARMLPCERLGALAGSDPLRAYALLLGTAGLIPDDLTARRPDDTKLFIRSLWDIWWKQREQLEVEPMKKSDWNLSGLRPANHPVRRMMAGACLFTPPTRISRCIAGLLQQDGKAVVRELTQLLRVPGETWWHTHFSWNGAQQKPTALLGDARSGVMVTNILIPYLAAIGFNADLLGDIIRHHLPAEPLNAVIRQTVHTLFGRDCPAALYRTPLARQGLMQVFHDFCLNDRSRCGNCTLPSVISDQSLVIG
jgi:hypothetical protein